eukprot:scaffold3946_cov177-Amphora_coffeaeformis.AAC.23
MACTVTGNFVEPFKDRLPPEVHLASLELFMGGLLEYESVNFVHGLDEVLQMLRIDIFHDESCGHVGQQSAMREVSSRLGNGIGNNIRRFHALFVGSVRLEVQPTGKFGGVARPGHKRTEDSSTDLLNGEAG